MLTVGDRLPDFALGAVAGTEPAPEPVTPARFRGRWLVLLYWPLDFSFACVSELTELSRRAADFATRGAQVIGVGQDLASLVGRRREREGDAVPFPLLDDSGRELAAGLGLLQRGDGCAVRATFIADPARIIRWVRVSDLSVGRSVPEVLRALVGLQSDEPAPRPPSGAAPLRLTALIPMCAWCKRVREEDGDWAEVEEYIRRRTGREMTHGICPQCLHDQSLSGR